MIRTVLAAACVCWVSAAWADDTSIAHGKEVAGEACASCHQVTTDQVIPPPVNDPNEQSSVAAPTFLEIAHKHGADPAYLRNAILLPQHPMREQDWNEPDLKAVVDYIQSLPR